MVVVTEVVVEAEVVGEVVVDEEEVAKTVKNR